jgi:carboxylesterase type B
MMVYLLLLAACLLPVTFAAPTAEKRQLTPAVQLPYATVVGSSVAGVDSFKGIPYAKPPVGPLQLKPPQPITSNIGTIQAIGLPRVCLQYLLQVDESNLPVETVAKLLNSPFGQTVQDSGEDCLTINVQRPSYANENSRLPVVFWIYGSAFQFRSTQAYDATELILSSVLQGKDIVYVAVNYRVGGFGFLPGREILADGLSNLGLLDQRLGLHWVADNIIKFGGDPSKATIWGESAGSVSVLHQMTMYNGNNTYRDLPLFRGAIVDSGSIIPSDPVNCPKGEAVYNTVVQTAGCVAAQDTLACLRSVDYTAHLNAGKFQAQ